MAEEIDSKEYLFNETAVKYGARLLYVALKSKHSEDPEYSELYNIAIRTPEIFTIMEIIAEQFEMEILDKALQGISLAPRPRSQFATRAKDYDFSSRLKRPLLGLILISVTSFIYPNPYQLEDDDYDGIQFNLEEIDEYIREKIVSVKKAIPEHEQNPSLFQPNLKKVLFEYEELKFDKGIEFDFSTSKYYIRSILTYLERQGLIIKQANQDGEDTFYPQRKMKVYTQQLCKSSYFQQLQAIKGDKNA